MYEQIDILLPTYNGEKYLKQQIESILNQSYKNIKIIISDDCSKDKTLEILKQYQNNKNIEIYFQEKNIGVTKNIEFLLQKVTANYYMLADQDDIWKVEKVEKSLEKLKQENVDLVFGDLEIVDENLNTIHPSFNDYMKLTKKIKKYVHSYKLNYLYNCITGCTILAKKETIKDILPIPKTSKHLIHDHWIGLIANLNGKVAYMPEKYIKYRQHGTNEVGIEKKSYKLEKFEEIRNLFIDVKLGIFGVYVENKEKFPPKIQRQNSKALKYFQMLKQKKNFNFRYFSIFHKLYKTESFMYYIENFIILNFPCLGKIIFKYIKLH